MVLLGLVSFRQAGFGIRGIMMNVEKFIKLMMMTTSPHDGEALTAIRKVNAELAALNCNWEELLHGKLVSQQPPSQREWSNFGDQDGPEIAVMFEKVLRKNHSPSFLDFLDSIHSFWKNRGYLTEKQYNALKRAAS